MTTLEKAKQATEPFADHDKLQLLQFLMGEIETEPEPPELSKEWISECERRHADYVAGRATARPVEDVLRDAYARLRKI